MQLDQQQRLRELAREMDKLALDNGLTPNHVLGIHHEQYNLELTEREHVKTHALEKVRMDDQEFEEYCRHLLDGGGVVDDMQLAKEINQAIFERDQPKLHKLTAHLVKSRLKALGLLTPQGAQHDLRGASRNGMTVEQMLAEVERKRKANAVQS